MGADLTVQNGMYKRQGGNVLVLRESAGRLYSEDALWGNCPLINHHLNPGFGYLLDENFVNYNAAATTGDWILTQASAGTAVISTTVPGALLIDSGDTTTLHGVNLQRAKSMFLPASGKDLWFEATILLGTAVIGDFFIGLAALDTTIIAASAMTTNNRIGFTCLTADGVMLFDCDKAGVNAQTAAAVTLSITVPHTLGFYYDGTADTVQCYVDGVAFGSAVATTYIPKLAIYPSLVCQNHGTSQPTMTVSGLRVFQLR